KVANKLVDGKMAFVPALISSFSVPKPHKTDTDWAPAATAARTSVTVSPTIRQASTGTPSFFAACKRGSANGFVRRQVCELTTIGKYDSRLLIFKNCVVVTSFLAVTIAKG